MVKRLLMIVGLLIILTSARLSGQNSVNFGNKTSSQNEKRMLEWQILFEDNFDGKEIDESKWTVAYNYTHTDQEQQIYFPNNAYVEDGNLVIKTEFEPTLYFPTNRTYNYTSAWLDTKQKFNFTSGSKIEARILLPQTSQGDQIWPAFWTLGEIPDWPNGGEIDVMEMSTNWNSDQLPHLYGTYHWGQYGNDYCGGCGTVFPYNINLRDWIVFSAVWEESQISWYINDILYRVTVQGEIYPNQAQPVPVELPKYPQYLILNDAIDGNRIPNPSDYPKYMKVDYVRVYSLKQVAIN